MKYVKLFTLLMVLCLTPAVLAQADCPSIVKDALSAADSSCSTTGRNQACYGNITLNATPREGAADFQFQQPGDMVDVIGLQSLQLSSLDNSTGQWGVAVMRLQANLPDTLPGQNVTFLLFGDVNVIDASDEIVEVPVTATTAANVRLRPSTTASVLQALKKGQTVTAIGRSDDSSWIDVRLDDHSTGWVSSQLLEGDLFRLLPIEPGAPVFGAMQAFYFTTGYQDSPCATAPDSGILIQTPKGAGTIKLRVNDVDIQLGSTVYIQAVPDDTMSVSVIEGHTVLTAQGQTQIVPAGTVAVVPLDTNGHASGVPGYPEPYAFQRLKNLPVYSQLLTPVKVQRALARFNIDSAIAKITSSGSSTAQTTPGTNNGSAAQNAGLSGTSVWSQHEIVTFNTCTGPLQVGDTLKPWNPTLVFSADHQSFTYNGAGPNGELVTLGLIGNNVYQGVFGITTYTFTFSSPTRYSLLLVSDQYCRFELQGTGQWLSGSQQ